jgi:hypothetical protein
VVYKEAPTNEISDSMINFAKMLIMSILVGEDVVWSQEERMWNVLDIMKYRKLISFNLNNDYN